ncbi:MAG: Mu transposase C-terminal domain-containing protein [Filifactoraceae bacterium]
MEMLSVKEVAALKGCTDRYIKKMILEKKLPAQITLNNKNRKQYTIPLDSLPETLRLEYHKRHCFTLDLPLESKVKEKKALSEYSNHEREEISFWLKVIKEWQTYRKGYKGNMVEADAIFIKRCVYEYPDRKFTERTLYSKWKSIKEDEYDGLIDNRGKALKGRTSVNNIMWDAFKYYFLDEAEHPIKKCYEYMEMYLKGAYPEMALDIPSLASFRRKIEADIPEQIIAFGRKGLKAYRDLYGLYIRREYESMEVNDYWIGDTHTLDIQSKDDGGLAHRLHLSAFMDARTGVFVGFNIANSSSSQNTLLALRHGILSRGCIPKNIYVDNGREYLTHDIGGLGHRKKKSKNLDNHIPPPIFERLGIKMTNAEVKNAKAKTIERRFRDVKDHLSRLFDSYTGGNIMERPERLKAHIKNGEVIIDKELIEQVSDMIEYYLNYTDYNGAVSADRGKRKIDIYNQGMTTVRRATEDDLDLLLMRSSKLVKVGRRGLTLSIYGEKYDYYNEELLSLYQGKDVYYRYDPMDLSSIRVYDNEDRFIMQVDCDNETVLSYGVSKDDIKTAKRIIRSYERKDIDVVKKVRAMDMPTAKELVLRQVAENKANPAKSSEPKVIELVRANENSILPIAVGENNVIDLDKMIENAEKNRRR